MNWWL